MKLNVFFLSFCLFSICSCISCDEDNRPCCQNAGSQETPCNKLIAGLEELDLVAGRDYDLDTNGCPVVKNQFVLQTDSLTYKLFRDTLIVRCPCDSSLVLITDTTQLTAEERKAVGSAEQDEEGTGNYFLNLPDLGNFNHNTLAIHDGVVLGKNNIKVAVLDSGLDTPTFNSLAQSISVFKNLIGEQYPFIPTDTSVIDNLGHGSLVTKIIGLNSIESGTDSLRAQFYIFRIINDRGIGTIFSAACGLRCALRHEVQMINASWGSPVKNAVLKNTIDSIASRNDLVIIASKGNDCRNTDIHKHYPSDYDRVFGIAGLDTLILGLNFPANYQNAGYSSNHLWVFSNRTYTGINMAAPCIILEQRLGDTLVSAGTSFAAPYALANGLRFLTSNPGSLNLHDQLTNLWTQTTITVTLPCESEVVRIHPIK